MGCVTLESGAKSFTAMGGRPKKPTGEPRKREKVAHTTIQIPTDLDEELDEYCGEMRIKRQVLSRIVRWFLAEPDVVKRIVLSDPLDRGLELVYAERLENMARSIREHATRPNHRPGGVILYGDGTVIEAPKPPLK